MKQISMAVLVLAFFSLAPVAGAQTPVPYMTVDEISVTSTAAGPSIAVTGIVQGSTTSSTRTFTASSVYSTDNAQKQGALDRCHRSLLLALSKPGQYVARVDASNCAIALVTP